MFPNETAETYYVAPIKKKQSKSRKSELAKGKLVDKYKNKQNFIRKGENLEKAQTVDTNNDILDEDSGEYEKVTVSH